MKKSEIVRLTASLAGLAFLSQFAFAKRIRHQIGNHYDWTCQNTGAKFSDGVMIHIAHYKGKHQREVDYNPKNGRPLCVREHVIEHIEEFLEKPNDYTNSSLRLLTNVAWENGLHTFDYYKSHPEQFELDREDLTQVFAEYGVDIYDILPVMV